MHDMEGRVKNEEINVSELEEQLERKVEKAGIRNCSKIVLSDPNELRKLGNLTDEDIESLKGLAADIILPTGFITAQDAKDLYSKRWKTISMDCAGIDSLLGGGIPTRGITELYGVSGAGKTQFCLQLSITVQYPKEHGGLNSGCVYICTEDRFPSRRHQELLPLFPRGGVFDPKFLENAADNVFVDHIPDMDSLNECLGKRLPELLRMKKIGLVIIDSIAAVFRPDYTNKQLMQRAKDMRAIGSQLHKLATEYSIAVLCVNQVADSLETNETVPALGLAWANLVTTKLQVQILATGSRKLTVVSSPDVPSSSLEYHITTNGIETT